MPREALAALALTASVGACHVDTLFDHTDTTGFPRFPGCSLNTDFMYASVARDAVPTLDDPIWVDADRAVPDYLEPDTRVIGLHVFGTTYAVPHNMLWHHEILNLDPGGPLGPKVAVTHCPLTGSSRVFDRGSVGGSRLGVSGILFMNNLMFFDRSGDAESIWPQMLAAAGCGPQQGAEIETYPFAEMSWAEWLALYPATKVLAQDQGFDPETFDYTAFGYPYGPYRTIEPFWRTSQMPPPDARRFAKELVIGVPSRPGEPGIAFPFDALRELEGPLQIVEFVHQGTAAVVLWSDAADGGVAFWPATQAGEVVHLQATASGFEDDRGGAWTVDGLAVSGPLTGERLVPIHEAYTAYWGAWAAFFPDTRLWE